MIDSSRAGRQENLQLFPLFQLSNQEVPAKLPEFHQIKAGTFALLKIVYKE